MLVCVCLQLPVSPRCSLQRNTVYYVIRCSAESNCERVFLVQRVSFLTSGNECTQRGKDGRLTRHPLRALVRGCAVDKVLFITSVASSLNGCEYSTWTLIPDYLPFLRPKVRDSSLSKLLIQPWFKPWFKPWFEAQFQVYECEAKQEFIQSEVNLNLNPTSVVVFITPTSVVVV